MYKVKVKIENIGKKCNTQSVFITLPNKWGYFEHVWASALRHKNHRWVSLEICKQIPFDFVILLNSKRIVIGRVLYTNP